MVIISNPIPESYCVPWFCENNYITSGLIPYKHVLEDSQLSFIPGYLNCPKRKRMEEVRFVLGTSFHWSKKQ